MLFDGVAPSKGTDALGDPAQGYSKMQESPGEGLRPECFRRCASAEEHDVIVARYLRGSHYQKDCDDCEFHGNSPHPIRQYNAESTLWRKYFCSRYYQSAISLDAGKRSALEEKRSSAALGQSFRLR